MSDDTRDIAIATSTKVSQLEADMKTVLVKLNNMEISLSERRGAEKVARWVIGIGAGGVSALLTKFGGAILSAPLPK